MSNVRRYVRGPTKGYEIAKGSLVIDAASDRFLDVVLARINHFDSLPETLKEMALQKWKDDIARMTGYA